MSNSASSLNYFVIFIGLCSLIGVIVFLGIRNVTDWKNRFPEQDSNGTLTELYEHQIHEKLDGLLKANSTIWR